VHLFQFTNGINDTGPLTFESGIGTEKPCRCELELHVEILFPEWKELLQARLLENLDDINMMFHKELMTFVQNMTASRPIKMIEPKA
jgi:hypothetical protein